MQVAEVLEQLRPNVPFISGVTVSGGEATQQAGFVAALFAAIKADPSLSRPDLLRRLQRGRFTGGLGRAGSGAGRGHDRPEVL